ncbi:MAG: CRTAC1 family protein [Bacteroidota bacterium]
MKQHFISTIFLFATGVLCIGQTFTKITTGDLVNTPSDSRSVNWIDVNNDGYVDLFISNGKRGGQNNLLYLNKGDGTFSTVTGDPIVNDNMPSVGATWADTDNDGDPDCMVTNWYNQPNLFYENNRKGTFTLAKKGPVATDLGYSETATWGDYDNDGLVDLYVTHSEGNLCNVLYHNDGRNNFSKITSGLPVTDRFASRSANWTDFDLDGDVDLLVGNENQQFENLYRNEGNGNFSAVSLEEITGYNPGNTMSTNSIDFDNDGDLDFFFANDNGFNDLLRNNNDGTYSRLNDDEICKTPSHSFGSNWGDIDNDGDLDLYVTNAFTVGKRQPNFLYRNNGDGSFSRDTNSAIVGDPGWSYGCAFADYDNDGFLDLAVANCFDGTQPNSLYHNNGNTNHWLEIQCNGTISNRSAIGAKVKVKAEINGKETWQLREISAQSGYCGQNMLAAHIGLGNAARCSEIVIEWPSGIVDRYTDVPANQIVIVLESQSLRFTTDETVLPAPYSYLRNGTEN